MLEGLLAAVVQAAQSAPASLPGPKWVIGFLSQFGYLGILAMLLLCGLGVPIPEEVTLIGSGYLAYNGLLDWRIASAVCVAGILLGDTVVYSLGRRFGNSILRIPVLRHELTPERLARFDLLFARYGDWAIFCSRFIMGVRLASYFVAGRQRMPYWKFILLDLAGALLSGPTSVALGYFGGQHIETAVSWVKSWNRIALVLVAVIAVGGVIYTRRRLKKRRSAAAPPA